MKYTSKVYNFPDSPSSPDAIAIISNGKNTIFIKPGDFDLIQTSPHTIELVPKKSADPSHQISELVINPKTSQA